MLIIGYGNPLRGDDGAGALAAEAIAQIVGADTDVRVMHQLLPELAAALAETPFAIFIDAAVDVEPSTALRVQEIFPAAHSFARDTHFAAPAGLLALARDLYGSFPRAFLYSIPAENFAFGAPLSARAQIGIEHVREIFRCSGRTYPDERPRTSHQKSAEGAKQVQPGTSVRAI